MISIDELNRRLTEFRAVMNRDNPDWKMALIISKVNQFYFTGTMQDGLLAITREDDPILWVRRSVERARDESPLKNIEPMGSYRMASGHYKNLPSCVYLEREIIPLAFFDRLQKAFHFTESRSLDQQILKIRAVKSSEELGTMKKSGKNHEELLDRRVPLFLEQNISEKDFASRLFPAMIELGYHGVSRFSMFQTEILMGQIGFGENSCYPSYFNGPGGSRGQHAAVPLLGDPNRKLAPKDLVFVDIAFGCDGYHTDHTMTYLFKGELSEKARSYHNYCLEIQRQLVERLKPGEIPSQIYQDAMDQIKKTAPAGFTDCFMGKKGNQVKFLGHGVGLHVDEYPVIARGFDEPLQENMVLALEPKCAVEGVGTVGVEDTYVVTPSGGESLTGTSPGMIRID